MEFKYHKHDPNSKVEEECAHCFLHKICNKPQSIAYDNLNINSKKFREYLDKIIHRGEESEYLCEDYIEFRKYNEEGERKAIEHIQKYYSQDARIRELLIIAYKFGYNEGFKRALDITINNNI